MAIKNHGDTDGRYFTPSGKYYGANDNNTEGR